MSGEFKKEKIGVEMLGDVAGGTAVVVTPDTECCKLQEFKACGGEGRSEKCRNCWHLMVDFNSGSFICGALSALELTKKE